MTESKRPAKKRISTGKKAAETRVELVGVERNQRRAATRLKSVLPFDEWLARGPRSESQIEMYRKLLGESQAIADGSKKAPSAVRVRRPKGGR